MRRRPSWLLLAVAALAALGVAVSGSASASGGLAFGQSVDPSLVSSIDSGKQSTFHVMVFGGGPSLNGPNGNAYGIHWRDRDSNVGAQSATLTPAQIAALSSDRSVQYVAPDTPMAPTSLAAASPAPLASAANPAPPAPPAPPAGPGPSSSSNGSRSTQSGPLGSSLATLYPQIDGAPPIWAQGDTGAGVGIAIIDSGVTPRADFGNRLVQVALPAQDGTQLNDSVGHGSAVAGVAAGQSPDGRYVGIAPGATVYAINVARSDGVYTSDVIAGLNWVLQNAKADSIGVVNLSLSQTVPSSYYTSTLDAAVDLLWKQGIVVVVSSGNFGPNSEDFAPANDPWAITVGASDSNDTLTPSDDTLASFSSYGTTPDGFPKPEIVAPGRHIVTTIPADSQIAQSAPPGYLVGSGEDNYVRISGTSFSAPQVTGAVALMLQARHNLSPDQVKWVLTNTESPLPGSGAGALDLAGVASALQHPDNANKGYHWTNWAHPGESTADFLNSLGNVIQIENDELSAASADVQAQLSCLQASLALLSKSAHAYIDCAQKLDGAAAAWDKAAGEWSAANQPGNAAGDEKSAASDWQTAAADWTKAGNPSASNADTANQAAAWDRANTWAAAAWDAAAWDNTAGWTAAAWDAAAWDAAAWDSSGSWDAAAWDAAAWDAAAWDAAAWD